MSVLRRWFERERRCPNRTLGPFMTDWRCLLIRGHIQSCFFEPDTWMGKTSRSEWAGR